MMNGASDTVIGEITNASSPLRLAQGKQLVRRRSKEQRSRLSQGYSSENNEFDQDDIENDSSFASRSALLASSSIAIENSITRQAFSPVQRVPSANEAEVARGDEPTASKSRYALPAAFNMPSVDTVPERVPAVDDFASPAKNRQHVNAHLPAGLTEPRVTFSTSENGPLRSTLVSLDSAPRAPVGSAKLKTPGSMLASRAKTPASTKRDDEIDRLKRVLTSQGHWKLQRTALEMIAEMLRADMVDGEGLLHLAHPIRLHLLSSLSQIVLAACSCVEAACEFTSLSSKVLKKDFRAFSRELVSPLCSLAASLSTGCKASQDAGMRCLYNLYLANAELNLAHVLGADSMGGSKNVAARRTAANFVFNLIHAGDSIQSSALRDDALADAVIRFFMDNDAETRYIARRALREMMLFRPVTWIEEKVASILRERCIDEQVPYLKQFALEYPEAGRLLGIEGARPNPTSAVRSALRPARRETESVSNDVNSPERNHVSTPIQTPASIVSLATTATKYRPQSESAIKPLSERLNEDLNESELDEMLLRAHYAIRPKPEKAAPEEESSVLGEALRVARFANRPGVVTENEAKAGNEDIVQKDEDSALDGALLKARYANRPQVRSTQILESLAIPCPKGETGSSPVGEQLRARKIAQSTRRLDMPHEVNLSQGAMGWRRLFTIAVVGLVLAGILVWKVAEIRGERLSKPAVTQPDVTEDVALVSENVVSETESVERENVAIPGAEDTLFSAPVESEPFEPINSESDPYEAAAEYAEYEQVEDVNDETDIENPLDGEEVELETSSEDDNLASDPDSTADHGVEIIPVSADELIPEELPQVIEDRSVVDGDNSADTVEPAAETVPEPVMQQPEPNPESAPEAKVEEQPANDNQQQSAASNAVGVLSILFGLVFLMRPVNTEGETFDKENDDDQHQFGGEEAPKSRATRRRVSPPKGRFAAIEVMEDAALRPVMRSRRVVEPDLVQVQEVEGRGGVTLITPRKPRRSARSRSKSK